MSEKMVDRRHFLGFGAAGVVALTATRFDSVSARNVAPPPRDLFTLGVASGEPSPDGVVLWTRLAPEPLDGGGMPKRPVPVRWQVASDEIAGKWSLLAIALLDGGPRRFTELQRMIDGISQRMLSATLRQLERDGLVSRTVYPVVPPRVDYELTALGSTLLETTQALVAWTETHQDEIAAARTTYDARVASSA